MDPSTAQQTSNLQITDTVNELQTLFDMLPYDQDKVDEIQALSDKPRDEQVDIVSTFFPLMTDIVEEQLVSPALAQMQEQKSNLQVTVNEQPRTQINSSKPVVTFDQLFHLLAPQIGIEKTIDLYYFGKKCQRGEIPKCNIIPLMKGIVGEPALRSAVATLLRQKSSLQVTVNEQPRTQINSGKPVATFYHLYRLLAPQIGLDKSIDLYFLADKYQRGEIPASSFLPLMQGIVGEPVFRAAALTLLRQIRNKQVLRAQLSRSMNAATDRSHNT